MHYARYKHAILTRAILAMPYPSYSLFAFLIIFINYIALSSRPRERTFSDMSLVTGGLSLFYKNVSLCVLLTHS